VSTIVVSAYRTPTLPMPRLIASAAQHRPAGLDEHERLYGPTPLRGRPRGRRAAKGLIDLVERSGLTGRGGAGFPTARKMRSVASRSGPAVVIANGAEGEPASVKDRLLLTRAPHLILDGIALAAYAVGANEAFLCVHAQEVDVYRANAFVLCVIRTEDVFDESHRRGYEVKNQDVSQLRR